MLMTGAMHEDDWADLFERFWGWLSPPNGGWKIIADSQIGTYGVLALIGLFTLRLSAVAALPGSKPTGTCGPPRPVPRKMPLVDCAPCQCTPRRAVTQVGRPRGNNLSLFSFAKLRWGGLRCFGLGRCRRHRAACGAAVSAGGLLARAKIRRTDRRCVGCNPTAGRSCASWLTCTAFSNTKAAPC